MSSRVFSIPFVFRSFNKQNKSLQKNVYASIPNTCENVLLSIMLAFNSCDKIMTKISLRKKCLFWLMALEH